MNRAQFEDRLRKSAVELVPVSIDGWDEPIYVRRPTMEDVKKHIAKPDTDLSVAERLAKDEFVLERDFAGLVRDSNGALLYDAKDDEQMGQLRTLLDNCGPEITRQIRAAIENLQKPTKAEVDDAGN